MLNFLFNRQPLRELVADALYAAEREQLEAENRMAYYAAKTAYLERRVHALRARLAALPSQEQ